MHNAQRHFSLPLKRMSRLFPLLFFTWFIAGCTPEDKPVNTVDTTKHDSDVIADTAHHDSTAVINDSSGTPVKVYDCSILRKRIPKLENDAQIQKDLATLSHCGIDSFAMEYIVPNLFPGFVNEKQIAGNDSLTYNDFMKHLREFEMTDAYVQLHAHVRTLDSLRLVKYDVKKLYVMKPVLGQLGFTADEWAMFEGFVKTYPAPSRNYTWGQMLDDFEKYSSKNPE